MLKSVLWLNTGANLGISDADKAVKSEHRATISSIGYTVICYGQMNGLVPVNDLSQTIPVSGLKSVFKHVDSIYKKCTCVKTILVH